MRLVRCGGADGRRVLPVWVALAAICLAGCAGLKEPSNRNGGLAFPAIPHARVPFDGVLTGGQPTPEDIELAARGGFMTVINLRTDAESGFEWEPDAVRRLGLRYVHIPIAGPDALTPENVKRIDDAVSRGRLSGPVMLHCGSGNRVGAVLGLREAWIEGSDPVDALVFGLDAGLTRLEPRVRELLELPPAE